MKVNARDKCQQTVVLDDATRRRLEELRVAAFRAGAPRLPSMSALLHSLVVLGMKRAEDDPALLLSETQKPETGEGVERSGATSDEA